MDSILINHLSSFLTVHCTLDTASLHCRHFHWVRANGFNCESFMLKLPKGGGNGASQAEGGGGGEKEEKKREKESSSPSPLSFFCPDTYAKGYYFYSLQSSSVIKSKMAASS